MSELTPVGAAVGDGGPSREFELDLDALVPRPKGHVVVKGRRYPVWSILDVPGQQMMEILADQAQAPKTMPEQVAMIRRHLSYLVPELPAEVVQGLTTRQLLAVYDRALGIANPPAETGETASIQVESAWGSSSPSPDGSMAGASR